ncbi:hypothetical protein KC207_04015, partial [Phycicoccus sp. BSK3Z-2]
MRACIRRGLGTAALVIGSGVFFSASAWADESMSGTDSLLGGNVVEAVVEAPVTAGGNAVSVVGDSKSSDSQAAASTGSGSGSSGGDATSGEDSVAGGNDADAVVQAPVTAGGNAVSVVGDSKSSDSQAAASTGSGS